MLAQVIFLAVCLLSGVSKAEGGETCPELPVPDDGGVEYLSRSRGYRTYAKYYCDEGYTKKGAYWEQCSRAGEWDRQPHAEPPTCEYGSAPPKTDLPCETRGRPWPVWPNTACTQPLVAQPGDTESLARVVGGKNAALGSVPWIAQLRRQRSQRFPECGASLIDRRWVLTAARCVDSWTTVANAMVSLGKRGSDKRQEHGQSDYGIEKIIVHGGFSQEVGAPYDNDIALLRLDRDVEYSDYIRPVCLPTSEFYKPGDETVIMGWGDMGALAPDEWPPKQLYPTSLQVAKVFLQNDETCRASDHVRDQVTDNMICGGIPRTGGVDACFGDSGGPVVMKDGDIWKQIGVVSWGEGCAHPDEYGYYTEVYKYSYNYSAWIPRMMRRFSG